MEIFFSKLKIVWSTGIYKYVYMGYTVDLFFCNVYTVWILCPCFSFLSQSKDIYCSLIGTFLLCVYTTHPVYPALCQVSPGNIGPRLPVTLCRISSYKVPISITPIIHQFCPPPPITLDTWVLNTLLANRASWFR